MWAKNEGVKIKLLRWPFNGHLHTSDRTNIINNHRYSDYFSLIFMGDENIRDCYAHGVLCT